MVLSSRVGTKLWVRVLTTGPEEREGSMRRYLLAAALLMLATMIACGGGDEAASATPSTASLTPVVRAALGVQSSPSPFAFLIPTAVRPSLVLPTAVPPTRSPLASPTPDQYNSTGNMYRIFGGFDHPTQLTVAAIGDAIARNDTSQVPVIIDFMRFLTSAEAVDVSSFGLAELTGQPVETAPRDWGGWAEWLGMRLDQYPPPPGYLQWKASIFSLIDPRFATFLLQAQAGSRINPVEIVWGGVRPDGIPDLLNPAGISPSEAGYLLPDDRVFGLSVNGEHKAYPLRIVNAHEMVNDVVGGEPIALAY